MFDLLNKTITIKSKGATTGDALDAIIDTIRMCERDPVTHDIADMLKSQPGDFFKNLYTFAYKSAYFERNPPDHQRVRTLRRFIADGRGSCVDYTVFISSILLAAGHPVNVKLVSTNGVNFGHIYPVTIDGVVLDCVYGQNEGGREQWTRPVNSFGRFNEECPHKQSKSNILHPMKLSILNGTNTVDGVTSIINGLSTINCAEETGTRAMVDDVPVVAAGGMWCPRAINGVELWDIEALDDDDTINATGGGVTAEEYDDYVLAVMLGDPQATSTNGLKDWLNKRREKKQDKKDAKAQKKADRKANKEKRRENWTKFAGSVTKLVESKAGQMDAESKSMLAEMEKAGIDPNPEALADMLAAGGNAGGDGGGDDKGGGMGMMLPLAGLALLAMFMMKK